MWRHGRSRPLRPYHVRSRRRKRRRSGGGGTGSLGERDERLGIVRGRSAVGRAHYNLTVALYTRTGDEGETGLFDGTRVSKHDLRVEAYGDIDELNALLGVVLAGSLDADLAELVAELQRDLFALGSRLADPRHRVAARVTKAELGPADVERLERWIDRLDAETPPLRRFILPGGSAAGAGLHHARTVCRRAERRIVALGEKQVESALLVYTNRLSDLLFAMARVVNHRGRMAEREW